MDKARDFGAGALFNQILSLLMSQNLEDQERHLLVKDREIISNLSIAAGLPKVISTMRSDIDHLDEYVRNTTARAFSVVASVHGIPASLPFLKSDM
ncbi:2209_t:CDS:2 [Entrophospora sp. SA101]|nr:3749_t:CDS:2 [Entrophospora sp. SA101]CAJ0635089.1 15880_t:CDS:2 [Entrophospora sp. SA101]CAJ0747362.1 22072_t:CDS:2 [Entrophospora sp. SA101]CAJ0747960.1 22495_t:CDS:2 [Entrophospora sp. SA101]CAJ0752315.1 2209_t:CDS:2 [Entrophospora sp. SA101]